MRNNTSHSQITRCVLTLCVLLMLVSLIPISSARQSAILINDSTNVEVTQQKFKVFCDHPSHGSNGYTTVYCYPNQRDAADVARAHNQYNFGHSARVISCN
jgi:hypothetical protein